MKFAEHLSAHITPEWRKQYIQYEHMKELLYSALDALPNPIEAQNQLTNQLSISSSCTLATTLEAAQATALKTTETLISEHVAEFEQEFFPFCEEELKKIDSFFAEKLAEAKRKFNDLKSELNSVLPGIATSGINTNAAASTGVGVGNVGGGSGSGSITGTSGGGGGGGGTVIGGIRGNGPIRIVTIGGGTGGGGTSSSLVHPPTTPPPAAGQTGQHQQSPTSAGAGGGTYGGLLQTSPFNRAPQQPPPPSPPPTLPLISFHSSSATNRNKDLKSTNRKTAKKISDLKLAFSEFYLSLVLLQNYQELNYTGFRKILKKHDKLLNNSAGLRWRQENVDGAAFYTSKEVTKLIEETENLFTNVLEDGDRSRAMKRLRVPPLNAQQSLWTTFRVGFYGGAFLILLILIAFAMVNRGQSSSSSPSSSRHFNISSMCRLFRGPFFICLFLFLIGVNVYGWRTSGVNHVLIFELNPRDHISEQHLFEVAFSFAVIWALCLLGYLFSPTLDTVISVNPNLFPLINVSLFVLFLFNPTKTFNHNARRWLIRVLFRVFAAPFYHVTFADFWLADQLNSLSLLFSDFVYYICFYINFYSNDLNNQSGKLCLFDSRTYLIVRAIFTALPAWFRFAQCLRRYRDDHNRSLFPHVVNAGKYSTTFFVVFFSLMTELTIEVKNDKISSPVFSLWIISLIISSIYTYIWDIKMDWGLMECNTVTVANNGDGNGNGDSNSKMSKLLREEIVYSSTTYYYFAYVEDFIGRSMWAFTISLNHVGSIDSDVLTTATATVELFRRFIWNFFRLENEHLNNCGEFRAVRDISIAPMAHSNANDGGEKTSSASASALFKKKKPKARLRRSIQYSINSNGAKSYHDGAKPMEVALLMESQHHHKSSSPAAASPKGTSSSLTGGRVGSGGGGGGTNVSSNSSPLVATKTTTATVATKTGSVVPAVTTTAALAASTPPLSQLPSSSVAATRQRSNSMKEYKRGSTSSTSSSTSTSTSTSTSSTSSTTHSSKHRANSRSSSKEYDKLIV